MVGSERPLWTKDAAQLFGIVTRACRRSARLRLGRQFLRPTRLLRWADSQVWPGAAPG
jgi:hypothetical protein